MSEPVTDNPGKADGHLDAAEADSFHEGKVFSTTLAHQIFLLVSTAFLLFELMFLWFYSDRSWFGMDIIPFSVPVALIALVCAHLLLQWGESAAGCLFWSFLFKGLPPGAYRSWVEVNEEGFQPGLRYGNRRAIWSAVDRAELTVFGNLLLKSRSTSGASVTRIRKGKTEELNPPPLLFKVPFGVASRDSQMQLIAILKNENGRCHLNSRLEKQVSKAEPKGTLVILNIVSACLVLFFIDVAYSTFSYLEMLKQYTLAGENAEAKAASQAEIYFARAEDLRLHPLPVSWVTRKMFQTPSTRSGVMQIRADALWSMNRHDDAIASMRDALEDQTKNFRAELKLARFLVEDGKVDEAYKVLDKAAEKSKKALVPRMYVLALLHDRGTSRTDAGNALQKDSDKSSGHQTSATFYQQSLKDFDQELFKDNTGWPPGVSPYLPDVWHRDDVEFVVPRLLNFKAKDRSKK